MKAIKLASIFAVTAVAAAVSTTTVAAEPVFSGTAGLTYTFGEGRENVYGSEGEVNIIGDTGLIYFDIDMQVEEDGTDFNTNEDTGNFQLDEIYVKTGAVSFGDFDGSLVDAAVQYASVEEEEDYSTDLDITLGVRYAVSEELDVALEMEQGEGDLYLAAAYTASFDTGSVTVSGGVGDTEETTAVLAIGASVAAGDAVTLAGYFQVGEDEGADLGSFGIGADIVLSEELVVSVALNDDTEEDGDSSIVEATVNYTVGDLRYYVTYLAYEADGSDYGIAGVEASF